MGFIETIKEKVHSLELEEKRTPVWEMLVKLYKENPKDARLASLCMRQMVMYLDELEGDPKWAERERENEYELTMRFCRRFFFTIIPFTQIMLSFNGRYAIT